MKAETIFKRKRYICSFKFMLPKRCFEVMAAVYNPREIRATLLPDGIELYLWRVPRRRSGFDQPRRPAVPEFPPAGFEAWQHLNSLDLLRASFLCVGDRHKLLGGRHERDDTRQGGVMPQEESASRRLTGDPIEVDYEIHIDTWLRTPTPGLPPVSEMRATVTVLRATDGKSIPEGYYQLKTPDEYLRLKNNGFGAGWSVLAG